VKVVYHLRQVPEQLQGGAVAIGNFDGVHRGHARIAQRLGELARQVGGPSVILTFDPHPVRLLRPAQAPPPLTWTERKAELLAEVGVEAMIAYPTDEALLGLSAREFFDRIVLGKLKAKAMVEGPNFCFGRDREGDVSLLTELCRQAAIPLEIVQPMRADEQLISSSRVRQLIANGDVDAATAMLTRPYRIRGLVTHGDGRGAKIGFPTANIDGVDTLVPAQGVYAARAVTGGQAHPAAVHVGPNPTFGGQTAKIEVHLIDFDASLYGQVLEVDFLAHLREIHPFGSVDELVAQLERDVARSRRIASEVGQSRTV